MTTLKRWSGAAALVFAALFLLFYSWLATAAVPPVEVALLQQQQQAPVTEADFTVTQPAPLVQAPALVAAPASRTDWEPYADQVFYALVLGIIGWIVKLLGPTVIKIGDWVGQRAAAEELIKDEKMNALSKALAVQALDFALGRMGYTRKDLSDVRIRNSVLSVAATFVHDQWPEIWKWVDKDQNGQIDWFESHNATQLPPVDHALKPVTATAAA